ncbi:MAG: hypothetical protein K2L50_03460 [Bacteroidales bacterium]|nr:hypothetical protein [Bacteroidales bacterium]
MKRHLRKHLVLSLLCLLSFLWGPVSLQGQEAGVQNRLQLAGRFLEAGEAEKALTIYRDLYKEAPEEFVYRQYINCLQVLADYGQAEKIIRKRISSSPAPLLLKVDLAANFIKAGQTKKAETVFKEIAENTDFSRAGVSVQELAQDIVTKTGRYDVAIAVYQKARNEECGNEADIACRLAYAASLADMYRLGGLYDPMLDEYLYLLQHDPSQHDRVYADLQALLASSVSDPHAGGRTLGNIKRLLARRLQQQADIPAVQEMLIWVLLQEKDFEQALVQARAFSRRFSDGGEKWLGTIRITAQNGRLALAADQYEDFLARSSEPFWGIPPQKARACRIELLHLYFSRLETQGSKDMAAANRLKDSYKGLLAELGRDPESFGMYRNLAKIYAYYLHEKDSARLLIENALGKSPFSASQKAELKIDLADILLYYNKVWDATLLYSQVEKDFKQDAVGFYAKLQNARLSYYIGEFEWAKSQLDVLKAATSKLIANDAMALSLLIKDGMNPDSAYDGLALVARADLLVYRHLYRPAQELLDQVLTMPLEGALFDEVYYRKARICLQTDSVEGCLYWLRKVYEGEEYDLLTDEALFAAASLLQLRAGFAVDAATGYADHFRFPEPDSPLFAARTREEKEQDKEAAMLLYRRLFVDYQSSSLAPLARQRYRVLRGDGI